MTSQVTPPTNSLSTLLTLRTKYSRYLEIPKTPRKSWRQQATSTVCTHPAPFAAGISTEGLALYRRCPSDSYVTVGLEHEPDLGAGESFIIVNEDLDQQWVSNLFFPSATSGESIYMNTETGGSWFALPGATNAIAGDDMQVLIAQFTSEDCLHGVLHALILPADGSPAFVLGQQFNCTECGPIGCADETACNYNPDAPNYPGGNANCTYADDGYDCEGNCLLDSDLDGICDPSK